MIGLKYYLRKMLISNLLTFLVGSSLAKDEGSKKEDSRGLVKWKRVNPMLTKVVTPYGVRDVCGVHRSEPCEYNFKYYNKVIRADDLSTNHGP